MNTAVKNSIVHHFADDTNLLGSDKNLKVLKKKINKDLAYLFDWLVQIGFLLILKKLNSSFFDQMENMS